MAGHGREVLSRWREVREWWLGSPYYEFERFIDPKGVRREDVRTGPSIGAIVTSGQQPLQEDHTQEWSLRERKIRDEKCSAACGSLPQAYYEREASERREHYASGPSARQRAMLNRPDNPPQPVIRSNLAETAWSVSVRSAEGDKSASQDVDHAPSILRKTKEIEYAPLHTMSGYAFGRSSMLAEEIAALAAQCGCPAAAITDPLSLVGCVEFSKACRRNGIKPLIGASIELPEGGEIVLIARTKRGYINLSRLISECHLGEPRCFPLGSWERLERHSADLVCLTGGDVGPVDRHLVHRDSRAAKAVLERLISIYGSENVFVEVERSFLPWQLSVERQLLALAEEMGVLPVAGGAVTHARPDHFPAQDVLVCIDSLCLIEEVIGRKPTRDDSQPQVSEFPRRALNAERYLRTGQEMAALYADQPHLLENTLRVAERCEEDVLPSRTKLPMLFQDDNHALREIVMANAFAVYPKVTQLHKRRLGVELDRIQRLGYSTHFLVAWDVCRWAREQGVQMSGRGSVVDSAVAHVLGISRIDAIKHRLHFDRFLPGDGSKRPDIDIDFEARKRDDIREYMIGRYGIDRVATVCAIGAYCTRGIVREVGKVMGLPNETIGFLAKKIHGGIPADQIEAALYSRPELRDSGIPREKFRWVFALAERLMDVPRNIRTHSSGVVISDQPICDTVPVMWSASPTKEEGGLAESQLRMIQWDKRSAKHFFDKFDILCLRGQDVLAGVEKRVRSSEPDFSAEQVKATTDPEVYRAMRSGELIGIPQSASPAMRQAHMRLGTNDLHDASLVQAGIRPGVGGAVKINELIARRRGKPYSFDCHELERILGHTYGIIVFQEQVDQLLQTFCGYSGGQAEDIRDAIHKRRREDYGKVIKDKIIERVLNKGYSLSIAEQVFDYVSGFKGYGFAQGHALAFAEVSLRSVWMMQNHPASYFASLLSAQPAGYYGPCTIANEARTRGVTMLPLDVNRSGELFEVEDFVSDGLRIPNSGIRVSLKQLAGLSANTMTRIVEYQSACHEASLVRAEKELKSVPRRDGSVAVALAGRSEGGEGNWQEVQPLLAFRSIFDFAAKVEPSRDELEALILAGAFDSLHPNRRALMWSIPEIQEHARFQRPSGVHPELPFDRGEPVVRDNVSDFSVQEKAIHERALLDMDVDHHLMAFERARVSQKGAINSSEAKRLEPGTKGIVVGNPIRLRFPPTASGKRVVFFDLEDEAGLLNVTAFDDVYQRDGRAIVTSQYVTVVGVAQDRDGSPAFLASRVFPYKPLLGNGASLPITSMDFLVG